jgi:GT2 family glycosyltransferase
MRPVGKTNFGRAVAAATSSPLRMDPAKFHYGDERAEVDTVHLGFFRRQTLEDLGGYDESQLQWAAEDQELNFRLRQRGGLIVLDPEIRSWYFPRETVRALARQYRNYGVAKASTLAKHGFAAYVAAPDTHPLRRRGCGRRRFRSRLTAAGSSRGLRGSGGCVCSFHGPPARGGTPQGVAGHR